MAKRYTRKPKMSVVEATTFEHESEYNNALVEEILSETRDCGCEPRVDVFTYQRWLALGFQVQRGEHGIKLQTWVPVDKDNPDKSKLIPRFTTVFCRCQVKAVEV